MAHGETRVRLYTIGHSNHTLEHFLGLLRAQGIDTLVDVRTRPFSGYSPHFSRNGLKAGIEAAGLRYVFLGRELGGQPEGDHFYDENGHALYWKIAETGAFQKGLERLVEEARGRRTAIMCSEEDPSMCHRRLLITKVLFDRRVGVAHIRGDGTVITEAEVRAQEEAARDQQLELFGGEVSERESWRSIQSGLQKSPPNSSLGF